MADSPSEPPPRFGKTGRNEARKLRATLLNNLAAALFLAAFVQPILSVVQQARAFTASEFVASLAFAAVGLICFLASQWVANRLED